MGPVVVLQGKTQSAKTISKRKKKREKDCSNRTGWDLELSQKYASYIIKIKMQVKMQGF